MHRHYDKGGHVDLLAYITVRQLQKPCTKMYGWCLRSPDWYVTASCHQTMRLGSADCPAVLPCLQSLVHPFPSWSLASDHPAALCLVLRLLASERSADLQDGRAAPGGACFEEGFHPGSVHASPPLLLHGLRQLAGSRQAPQAPPTMHPMCQVRSQPAALGHRPEQEREARIRPHEGHILHV